MGTKTAEVMLLQNIMLIGPDLGAGVFLVEFQELGSKCVTPEVWTLTTANERLAGHTLTQQEKIMRHQDRDSIEGSKQNEEERSVQ